jgi:hypothetical protein
MKELSLTDSHSLSQLTTSLQSRITLSHEHYLPPLEYFITVEQQLCSSTFRLGVVFSTLELTL